MHQTDVAHWSLGPAATLPTRVWSLGGRLGYEDQGQTPNMQLAVYEFGDVTVVIEVRGLVEKAKKAKGEVAFPQKVSNEFYTSEGMVRDGKFFPKEGGKEHDVTVEPVHVTPGGAVRQLHRLRPQPRRPRRSMPRSSTAITPPRSATWPTSPTAWASRYPSARSPMA